MKNLEELKKSAFTFLDSKKGCDLINTIHDLKKHLSIDDKTVSIFYLEWSGYSNNK